MKLTQTHGTIGGTGYYRGNNGIVYYGNPQNGYLTESLQSQYQRQSSTPTSAYSTSSSSSYNGLPLEDIGRGGGGGGGGVNLSGSLLEGVLFVALSIFSLTVFLAVIAVFMVFYAVLSSWPYYVRTIIKNFIQGTIDRPLILITAALIFLAGYFVFCAYKVLLHRKMRSKGYLIAGTLEVGPGAGAGPDHYGRLCVVRNHRLPFHRPFLGRPARDHALFFGASDHKKAAGRQAVVHHPCFQTSWRDFFQSPHRSDPLWRCCSGAWNPVYVCPWRCGTSQ